MDKGITDEKPKASLIALFLFYNYATGKQAKLAFSKDFRHCNIIIYDGLDYVLIELDKEGIKVRVIAAKSLTALIRNLKCITTLTAQLCIEVKQRKSISWKPFTIRTCNEQCRYASGVDIGVTFNPLHLYNKLIRYDLKVNYEILSAWRRE